MSPSWTIPSNSDHYYIVYQYKLVLTVSKHPKWSHTSYIFFHVYVFFFNFFPQWYDLRPFCVVICLSNLCFLLLCNIPGCEYTNLLSILQLKDIWVVLS